ncbi:MAG TPA: PQQ-dependent sugar dehydrogenase [Bryobacteraceae bacterium]|nr:PQQ-dependent sugar dehydrogenase [Bryobacteraceae bacterium]
MRLRLLIIPGLALAAAAQTPRLAADGVYTKDQANRGKVAYASQCASCHGPEAGGGNEAPGLTGNNFLAKWRTRSANDLFENIRTTMPADRPGTLSPSTAADLLAWIFAANKFPAGAAELSPQRAALKQIRLGAGAAPVAGTASSPDAPSMLAKIEGRPIETLPTEKSDNRPAFPEQTRAPYHATAPFNVTTLIDKMPAPWSLAFLPDGKILLTHRLPGSIRILDTKGVLSASIAGVAELASPTAKGIGLLDVVLDPNFATNHRIFFTFFDYVDGTNTNTCVARARLDEASTAITEAKVIFRAVPTIPSKRLGGKTGGRIAIATDGTLFVSTGDRSDSPPWDVAQRLDSHLGKILHITIDGAPAPDNPFLGKPGVLPEIWAYGIRNAEGLAFDPKTGRLWENEHGPRGGDELNIIEKGKNYGWPVIAHGIDYPGNAIGDGITHKEGMEEPVYYWDPVIAPSGLAFYTGNLFPQWRGSLFVGGLRARMLDRLTLANDKVVSEEPLLMELKDRIRDVRVGPDGAVYVLTDSGTAGISPQTPLTSKLLKLTPK